MIHSDYTFEDLDSELDDWRIEEQTETYYVQKNETTETYYRIKRNGYVVFYFPQYTPVIQYGENVRQVIDCEKKRRYTQVEDAMMILKHRIQQMNRAFERLN